MAQAKIFNGSSWVPGHLKVWNGSAWVGLPKFYDGSQWVALASTLPAPYLSDYQLEFNGFTTAPSAASAYIYVRTDGTIDRYINGSTIEQLNSSTDWLASADRSAAGNGDYEIRMDVNSGDTLQGDSTGVWLSDSTQRWWGLSQSGEGTKQTSVTLRIRKAGDAGSEVSDTFTITAQVTDLGGPF